MLVATSVFVALLLLFFRSWRAFRRCVAFSSALFTFSNHQLTGAAIGLVPGNAERSRTNFEALLADTPDGESRRYRFREVMKLHNTEYQANDLEIGVQYEHGALVHDGSTPPQRDPTGRHYVPSTRPGHRLPHAWVENNEQRLSTHDLVPSDGFVIITGQVDSAWEVAARQAAEKFGVRIDVVSIADNSTVKDIKHEWRRIREFGDDGAVLVRPDQIAAWRAMRVQQDPAEKLESVLRSVLRQSKENS